MTEILDVFLDGRPSGQLARSKAGQVVFEYCPDAPQTPLSASMPRSVPHHEAEVVMPWIDNLLPDNDEVRARWSASFGERSTAPFALLRHMGADCAGAVQILPEGETPESTGEVSPISVSDIAAHIRTLRQDTAAWDFSNSGGRWSLGGQQGKFALAKGATGWLLPTGRAASTHIIKVGVAGLPNSDLAEFVTMKTAALLGLPVAGVEYLAFDGEPALVTERFDRMELNGETRRIHQEDLCQALSLWRTVKYQSDGGPSPAAIVAFLRRSLDPRNRTHGVESFARALVFNWLAAGTDAHAKNFAILHIGARAVLAPLYDLISAAFFVPAKELHFEGRLAMKMGGEYRLRKVDYGRLQQLGNDLGVDESLLVEAARDFHSNLVDAVKTSANLLPDAIPAALRSSYADSMAARLEYVRL